MKHKLKIFLVLISGLLIHIFFFSINKHTEYNVGILNYHVNLAVNILKTGELKSNLSFQNYLFEKYNYKNNEIISINETDISKFDFSKSTYWYERNPGYGILLALTWKIFNIYSFIPIIILQILLNLCLSLIVYFTIKNITQNQKYALYGMIAYLSCLPLVFLSVYPSEDIWGIWSMIIFLYFIFKKKNIINFIIAFSFIGIGSYIHELPHTLWKYLAFITPIYYFYDFKITKEIIYKYLLYYSVAITIPFIILFPYILRNHILFEKYIETRFYGSMPEIGTYSEFDKSFLASGDTLLIPIINKRIQEKNLNLDRTSPDYWNVLNQDLFDYKKNLPWYIKIRNIYKRIPKLIFERQFYGLENSTGIIDVIYEKNKNLSEHIQISKKRYKTVDYIKEYPFTFATIFELCKAFIDIIIIFFLGNFSFFLYNLKSKNPKLVFLLIINIMIYGGNLLYFVDAKYFLLAYLTNYIFVLIIIFNNLEKLFLSLYRKELKFK